MRGRRPAGPEYVDQLDGTAQDKERLQAILETLGGQARLHEACDRIDVGESRFRQLREAALQGALEAIAPRPAGRPRPAGSPEAERIRELEAALAEKELALHEAQVRAEVALVLPRVVEGEVEVEKKNAPAERAAAASEAALTAPANGADGTHMNILQTLLELRGAEASDDGSGPPARRQLEQRVRQRAVAFAARLIERGYSRDEAARRLGLCERTLRQWEHDLGQDRPPPPLGRPPADSGPEQQQAAFNWLRDVGPGVGVPALRTHFPDMSRAELTELLHGYRHLWQADHTRLLHVLHWQRPGTVWAIDFAEPSAPGGRTLPPIDGRFPYLLAVRDLASGYQLLWQPVSAASADVVINELTPLFMVCGSPWVLKMDNGPAFRADDTQRFLRRWQTLSLFSPPYRPQYNGSIEAAIGSLKTRTHRLAAQAGHPDFWTSGVIVAARQQANASARPRRLHGAAPAEVWHSRPPLTAADRDQFRATVERFQDEARWEKHLPLAAELSRSDQAAVDRLALRRALVAHDLLWFSRRRIPAPIERRKVTLGG